MIKTFIVRFSYPFEMLVDVRSEFVFAPLCRRAFDLYARLRRDGRSLDLKRLGSVGSVEVL